MALLIAYANVAVLLLVRALRRRGEMAVRLALGASRARLARLLALEALVLAVATAALGLAASSLISSGLASTLEHHFGRRLPGGLPAPGSDGSVVWAAIASGAIVALVLTAASQDRIGGEAVVVVGESLARRLWPRARAVGQRLLVADPQSEGPVAPEGRPYLVVGVVRDVRQVDTDDGQVRRDTHALDAYVALLQNRIPAASRTSTPATRAPPRCGPASRRYGRRWPSWTPRPPWGRPGPWRPRWTSCWPGRAAWHGCSPASRLSPSCARRSARTAPSPTRWASASARSGSGWPWAPTEER